MTDRFIKLIASDANKYERKTHTIGAADVFFKANIGACLSFTSPEDFKYKYDEFFEKEFTVLSIERKRKVFKAYDLKRYMRDQSDKIYEIHTDFVKFLIECGVFPNICFTILNKKYLKDGVIYIYGSEGYSGDHVAPIDFIDILSNYYPYVCVWKMLSCLNLRIERTFIDGVSGMRTLAWEEVQKRTKLSIFPRGDQSNCYISSADILLDYVLKTLRKKRIRLDEENLHSILDEVGFSYNDRNVFKIGMDNRKNGGVDDKDFIIPRTKEEIEIDKYYASPIIYIIKEEIITHEKELFEKLPIMDKVLNLAYERDGAIKFLDLKKDVEKIRDKDILLYYGKKGEETAKLILKFGLDVELIGL